MKKIVTIAMAIGMVVFANAAHAVSPVEVYMPLRLFEKVCPDFAKKYGREINYSRLRKARAMLHVSSSDVEMIDSVIEDQKKEGLFTPEKIEKFCDNIVFMQYYTVDGVPLDKLMMGR